ncbi:methyl-CpG-binding domain protein 5 isoform X1 [Polyodon spathula]|uniref:methyl-CpG-binding domain protein 5 isoform X1 n=1 Tax=Polyodon spathula TaxID=7913 RepID=UPI001B7E5D97|nr:methyl-CpG-binding domain protein 5 isoform X1 [Polyodon spathula]XP_041097694.1 methyl-CpG-binding domain protein 5 isoform X1 [Polyodon spathula]
MNGGNERGRDKDGGTSAAHVPIGWQRAVEGGRVAYISPSGTVLSTVEEVRTYLLTDGTCKCGLECPLVLPKVFNFDPGAAVKPHSTEKVKAEEDMTKLCNHRRKVVAMAALCRSMEASPLALPGQTPGGALNCPENPPAAHSRSPNTGLNKSPPDFKNNLFPKYFVDKAASGVGTPFPGPKQDHCTYPRQRLLNPSGLIQYPRHHPAIPATAGLNPPSKNSMYAGGHPSNGSLDAITRANSRLSPELPHLGSPQPGRNLMPSPAQSPRAFGQAGNMPCSSGSQKYTRFTSPPNQTYDLSGCSDHLKGSPYPNSLPPSAQSHTHALDIHVSSTLASLANSLGGRSMHEVQGNFTPSSFSARSNTMGSPSTFSSSISSPAGSLEISPQRSRHSSTSSEHGFLGQQVTKSSHSPMPMSSPKFFMPPSPKSRLEGILQQYKDTSNSGSNSLGNHLHHPHQSNNFQPPHPPHSPTLEKKIQAAGAASATGFLGLPLGQILNQHHPHSSSFPASSLLSAAAKAQLASQKNNGSPGKEAHTKVQSTLQNSLPNKQTSPLLSNSSTTPSSTAPQDKPFKRKRQRRSPTVLTMLKESQMNSLRTGVDQMSMEKTFSFPLGAPQQQTVDFNPGLNQSDSAQSAGFPRQAEAQDPLRSKTPGVGAAQPLSALLHLLSMQNAQGGGGSSGSSLGQPALQSQSPAAAPSPVHLPPFPQPNPGSDRAWTPNLGGPSPSPSQQAFMNVNLNAALASVADPAGTTADSSMFPSMQDLNSQLLGLLGQFSTQTPSSASSSSSSSSPGAAQGSGSSNLAAQLKAPAATSEAMPGLPSNNGNHQHNQQSNTVTGPTNLPASPTSTNHKLAPSPGPVALHTPCQQLPLAELFPFMNPDQLLQLLSANTGLTPLLNPPFIGSLPLGLLMGQQQHQQQPQNILNHNPLNLLPSLLGGQADLPVNLLGLLNPPPNAVLPLSDPADKQALQALLTASLLLGQQQQPAMLPLGGLNLGSLNLDFLQQQFPPPQDGEKPTDATLLPGNDGFHGLGDGALQALQALLFPALSTPAPPIPTTLLSLNPALLPAFLGSTDGGASQTQVGISSSSMGPTSMTSTSTTTTPSSGAEAPPAMSMGDPLLSFSGAPGKLNPLGPQLLNPLLGASLLGDLAAFNTSSMQLSSLHTLLASSPLLLPGQQQHHLLPALQPPHLGMHLIQGQAALPGQAGTMNPMAGLLNTLQLNIDPGLPMADNKPINTTNQLEESISPAPAEDLPANQLPPEHLQTSQPLPQRSSPLDPYGSFMDAIYNSFLQVTGKKAQEAAGPTGHSVGQSGASGPSLSALSALAPTANLQASYPQFHGDAPALQAQNVPPSHSPRRACSVRNQDLTRLGMEAAHSPARGTPKLTEESRTPPRFEGVPAGKANSSRSSAQLLSSTPAFPGSLDEAKTDSSCQYSNGGHPRTEPPCRQDEPPLFRGCKGESGPSEGGGQEDPALCVYPSSRADCLNGTVLCPIIDQEIHPALHETEEGKGDSVQQETPKRGRKRRQTQQKLNSSSKEAFTEDLANLEPKAPAIQRPAKNKRRKIVR